MGGGFGAPGLSLPGFVAIFAAVPLVAIPPFLALVLERLRSGCSKGRSLRCWCTFIICNRSLNVYLLIYIYVSYFSLGSIDPTISHFFTPKMAVTLHRAVGKYLLLANYMHSLPMKCLKMKDVSMTEHLRSPSKQLYMSKDKSTSSPSESSVCHRIMPHNPRFQLRLQIGLHLVIDVRDRVLCGAPSREQVPPNTLLREGISFRLDSSTCSIAPRKAID